MLQLAAQRRAGKLLSDWWVTRWPLWGSDLPGCSKSQCRRPCRPKMAEPVLQRAAAAGSNYWLDCVKWGQMRCVIREPVDSGSLSQWLVINKIIGQRWQRFLEFFLICMSFYPEFFMTPFFICEGWMAPSTTLSLARAVDLNWRSLGTCTCTYATCTWILHRPDICNLQSFAAQVLFWSRRICMFECPTRLLELNFVLEEVLQGVFWIFQLLRKSAGANWLLFFLQSLQ